MPTTASTALDILAAIFFVVAGAWLVIAVCYSCLVLFYLRFRARGQLDNIYDESFGRLYLFGSRRFYIPLGCIFRRYIQHLQYRQGRARTRNFRFMTREERRAAMLALLKEGGDEEKTKNNELSEENQVTDIECPVDDQSLEREDPVGSESDGLSSTEGPICSICLGEYDEEESDSILESKTCSHQFHQDCILDWLQRLTNTECPCCRVAMVSDEDVWNTVVRLRREKKREERRKRKFNWFPLQRKDSTSKPDRAEPAPDETEASEASDAAEDIVRVASPTSTPEV